MMDKETSNRLSILRFPLIVGVIFVHNYSSDVALASGAIGPAEMDVAGDFVRNLVSKGIARAAVPLFFLMSGYLFFYGQRFSVEIYLRKLSGRASTLLVPFIFWNALTLAALAAAQAIPAAQDFFSGRNARIAGFSIFDYFNAMLGLDRRPISYQFWFIRDLIILVILSPIIRHLVEKVGWAFLSLLFYFWFIDIWPVMAPSAESTLFFSVGAALSCKGRSIFLLDRTFAPVLAMYGAALLTGALHPNEQYTPYVNRIGIILGAITFLCATKLLYNRESLRSRLLALSASSFFVFAAHEPLLTVAKKITYKIVQPSSEVVLLGIYFFIPVTLTFFLFLIYTFCSRTFPRATNFVTGGR